MAYSLFLKSLLTILLVLIFGNSVNAQLPQLRSVDCNRTNTLLTQPLYANILNANQYKFKVTNLELGVTDSIIKPVRWFYLDEIPSVSRYNCNYEVSVCMDVGSGFGAYGNICTPSSIALISKLRAVDCGKNIPVTLYPFSLGLYANTTVADSWDFQIRMAINTALVEDVFGLPTRKFQLNMASNEFQLYNREYEIRVRTTQGGIVQPWGPWCSVFTPFPLSKPRFRDLTSVSTAGRTIHNVSANQDLYILNNIGETITNTYTLYPGPGNGNPQTGAKILNQGFEQPSKWSVTMISPGKPSGAFTDKSDAFDLIELYPNPFSDNLIVKTELNNKNQLFLEIYNQLGEKIESKLIDNNVKEMNLNYLSPGIYYFNFFDSNHEIIDTKKVVKSY